MTLNSRLRPLIESEITTGALANRFEILKGILSDTTPELPLLISSPAEEINPLDWLSGIRTSPRVYWKSRESDIEIAGIGSANTVTSPDNDPEDPKGIRHIEEVLANAGQEFAYFLGGRFFDFDAVTDELWSGFPKTWYTLPEKMLIRRGNRFFEVAAASVQRDMEFDDFVQTLQASIDIRQSAKSPKQQDADFEEISRTDFPDKAGWISNVNNVLNDIRSGEIEKTVMARRTDFQFRDQVDPVHLLDLLSRENKNCYAFMFEPCAGKAFIGVTPERLFKLSCSRVQTEALSGTTARGSDTDDDIRKGQKLLSSDKNSREHGFVLKDVLSRLKLVCDDVSEPSEKTLLRLSNVSHIYSAIEGSLKAGSSIQNVLESLHPTPAVGGTPTEKALELIRQLEPFSRGWYAAPVGVVGSSMTDMAVAIRSALVSGRKVSLFAGAGIVDGSDPESEWAELEHKISTATKLLSGVAV